jgi:hypothetical protein
MDTAKATFILALLGALAWLPQIIFAIYKWVVRPQLRFVPESTTEIGYSSFGPIINQTFAISCSRKDALIERISLAVVHESGAKHDFNWRSLREKGGEGISSSGERVEYSKNQSAIALKVSTSGLTEKLIGFTDLSYFEKFNPYTNALVEKTAFLKKQHTDTFGKEVIKTKEFSDTIDFIKSGFFWKEGKYDVYLYANEATIKKPYIEHFKFKLTKENAEHLEQNIKITQDYINNLVEPKNDANDKPKLWSWNWANPVFERVNSK